MVYNGTDEENGIVFLITDSFYMTYIVYIRVLCRKILRHSGWAWFGRSLWPHQLFRLLHQKNMDIEGMGGPLCWKGLGRTLIHVHVHVYICTFVEIWLVLIRVTFYKTCSSGTTAEGAGKSSQTGTTSSWTGRAGWPANLWPFNCHGRERETEEQS